MRDSRGIEPVGSDSPYKLQAEGIATKGEALHGNGESGIAPNMFGLNLFVRYSFHVS